MSGHHRRESLRRPEGAGASPRSSVPRRAVSVRVQQLMLYFVPGCPSVKQATMTSSARKADESRSKRRRELEDDGSESPQLSSADTADPVLSDSLQPLCQPEPLEQLLNEMNNEIKNLLTKYAHILSERAAVDASYVQELDGILKEARTLENHLKQKKESLKQRFAMIANTLQS